MDAPKKSPAPSQKPRRNDVVAGVVVLAFVAALALGLCVAVAVAVYFTLQVLTPPPTLPAPPPPVVVVSAPRVEVAAAVVPEPPRVVRPVPPLPPPIVPPPVVAPTPSHVPKPPPPAATPKPGPTADNPVTPDLPHAKYDPAVDVKSFVGILSGEYPEPRQLNGKVTSYLKFVSPKGEYIGGGRNRSYDLSVEATPPRTHGPSEVSAEAEPYRLEFAASRSMQLVVGKYYGAMRTPFRNSDKPGLNVSGDGRASNTLTGSFVIWQLDREDGKVTALAVDFLQLCEGVGPPLYGRLRYKSKYE